MTAHQLGKSSVIAAERGGDQRFIGRMIGHWVGIA
jgi:hypothetical protein